jgi:cytochrome c55X
MRPSRSGKRALVKAAVAAAAIASLASAVASAGPMAPDRRDDLMNLLVQDCGSCHGLTMKGGLGPGLLPADLDGKPTDGLAEIILDGVPGTPMPPWRPFLAPAEAAWMVERLKEGLQ